MASAQTIRARTDADFANIREEYREAMGREPDATAKVSNLRTELRQYYASGGHKQAGQRGAADDGNPDTPHLQILIGNDMDWFYDSVNKQWSVTYKLPGSDRKMLFEVKMDQFHALWGDKLPPSYKIKTMGSLLGDKNITFAGNVAEMEGAGSFEGEYARIRSLALDEGKLPQWAEKSKEAMDIIFIAQSEGKSEDWVLDQMAKLPEFKKRFPKIDKFQKENNLTLAEGIQGFLEFEAGVNQTLQSFGYENTMKKVSPAMVGNLLDKGFNLKTIQDTVGGWKRMKEFKPALDAFNQVLAENGQPGITTLNNMLKFVQGKAPAEMYDLWEQSSIQEAAIGAGLGHVFSVKDAIDMSRRGDFTLETATQGMQKAAELLLRMRHEVDAGKFGLDHEELIDISLGATPRSGRPQAEILENVNRAVLSAQKSMQQKSGAFRTFSDEGRPQSASLRGLRSES